MKDRGYRQGQLPKLIKKEGRRDREGRKGDRR